MMMTEMTPSTTGEQDKRKYATVEKKKKKSICVCVCVCAQIGFAFVMQPFRSLNLQMCDVYDITHMSARNVVNFQ